MSHTREESMSHAVLWTNARVPPEIAHMIHTHVVERDAATVLQRRARLMFFTIVY